MAPTTRSGGALPANRTCRTGLRPGIDRARPRSRRRRSGRAPRRGPRARRPGPGRATPGSLDTSRRSAGAMVGSATAAGDVPPPRRGRRTGRRPPLPADRDARRLARPDRDELPRSGREGTGARRVAMAAIPVAVRCSGATPAAAPFARRDLASERVLAGCCRLVPLHREIRQQGDLLALVVDPAGDEQDLAVPPGGRGLLVEPWEDDDLDRALQVLHGDDRHRRLGLGDHGPAPVTIPPMTTRWPSSNSSRRSPE